MLLNGASRSGRSGQTTEDRDPYTDEVLMRVPLADQRNLNDAFKRRRRAAELNRVLPSKRSAITRRDGAIMEERRDEIIDWLIHESGSTRIKAHVEWQYARAVTFNSRFERAEIERWGRH